MTTRRLRRKAEAALATKRGLLIEGILDHRATKYSHSKRVEPVLDTFPVGTLRRIHDFICNETPPITAATKEHIVDMIAKGRHVECILDAIIYLPAMEGIGPYTASELIASLHHYQSKGWIPSGTRREPDPQVVNFLTTSRTVLTAIMDFSHDTVPTSEDGIYGAFAVVDACSYESLPVIHDERIFRLIWDRHEDSKLISDTFRERGGADIDFVLGILNNDVPVLSEGLL